MKSRKRRMAVLWPLKSAKFHQTHTKHRDSSKTGCLLCVCGCLPMPKGRMVGSSSFAPLIVLYTQRIAEKKFLVFGRVLPIERLCSTHFRKYHNIYFPYCAIIILAYLYIISLSYLYLMQLLYLYYYIFWSLHILQLSCLYNLLL